MNGLSIVADIHTLMQIVKHKRITELDSETLEQLRQTETLETLLSILHDDDYFVRSDASWALSLVGVDAIPGLLKALKDENWHVREVAAETIGWIGDAAVVPDLIEALSDQEGLVFEQVLYALADIASENEVPKLHELLTSDNAVMRLAAAYALEDKAGEAGIQGFIDLVDHGISGDRHEFEKAAECLSEIGKPAIPTLIELLQHDENEVLRRLAAQVLATIGDLSALPAMIAAINDESVDVQQDVITGLGAFGEEALPILFELIVDEGQIGWCAYSALRWIGMPAVKGLFALLDQVDEKKSKWVAGTIGYIQIDSKNQEIFDRLLISLDDENVNVQKGAAEALSHIRTREALVAVEEWRRSQQS